jgi:hypothetical protein
VPLLELGLEVELDVDDALDAAPVSDEDELDVDSDLVASGVVAAGPLTDDVAERESVMYQPLPLKTMPTG